jgi:hypothetical protein
MSKITSIMGKSKAGKKNQGNLRERGAVFNGIIRKSFLRKRHFHKDLMDVVICGTASQVQGRANVECLRKKHVAMVWKLVSGER